ncbi:MAG: hypothetical protein HY985_07890 [Magnetospirillum sp.]|nr:hypothetical protein [Magnetospirillum sp.]
MTFDFAPDWTNTETAVLAYSAAAPVAIRVPPLTPPTHPPHPTPVELAALVRELFCEGTLTLQELQAFGTLPELARALAEPLAPRLPVSPTRTG